MLGTEVTIIDYGVGNLLSVARALDKYGCRTTITNSYSDIKNSRRLILPGVGAYPTAMSSIRGSGIEEALIEAMGKGVPMFGICLGMQLFFEKSEEFVTTEGLGFLPGTVERLRPVSSEEKNPKLPNIGWRKIQVLETGSRSKLLKGLGADHFYYFANSYGVKVLPGGHCTAMSYFDSVEFGAIYEFNNIFGCQFHPERSGLIGLKMIENFLK